MLNHMTQKRVVTAVAATYAKTKGMAAILGGKRVNARAPTAPYVASDRSWWMQNVASSGSTPERPGIWNGRKAKGTKRITGPGPLFIAAKMAEGTSG
jgi:hypothetical protein